MNLKSRLRFCTNPRAMGLIRRSRDINEYPEEKEHTAAGEMGGGEEETEWREGKSERSRKKSSESSTARLKHLPPQISSLADSCVPRLLSRAVARSYHTDARVCARHTRGRAPCVRYINHKRQ